MKNNIFVAQSKNATGKTLFYMFEFAALVVAVVEFIFGIYTAAVGGGFMSFLSYLVQAIIYSFILFGIGTMLDLHCAKADRCAKKAEETDAPKTDAE